MLADATSITVTIGLFTSGAALLFFELFGVFKKRKDKNPEHNMETISQYVWWIVKRSKIAKVLVGVFVLSLFGHFMWGTWLLP